VAYLTLDLMHIVVSSNTKYIIEKISFLTKCYIDIDVMNLGGMRNTYNIF